MNEQIYKTAIINFELKVSKDGKKILFNDKPLDIKERLNKKGEAIKIVNFKGRTWSVPQLVAMAFITNEIGDNFTFWHVDGNRLNNNADNLRIISKNEYMRRVRNKINIFDFFTIDKIKEIKSKLETGYSLKDLCILYDTDIKKIKYIDKMENIKGSIKTNVKRKRITAETRQKIKLMYQNGHNKSAIIKAMGVSEATFYRLTRNVKRDKKEFTNTHLTTV